MSNVNEARSKVVFFIGDKPTPKNVINLKQTSIPFPQTFISYEIMEKSKPTSQSLPNDFVNYSEFAMRWAITTLNY